MLKRSCRGTLALSLAPVLSAAAPAQGNGLTLNNGGDVVFLYSDPSAGAPTGTFPPDISGDLFWKTIPGQALGAGSGTVEIEGLREVLFDTDWSTTPSFYDMTFDAVVGPENQPAFFTTGVVGTFVSLGSSGFGFPCTIAPSLCSTGCPEIIIGYEVDVSFGPSGSGIAIPADNVSGTAVTYYLPGGMVGSGPPCLGAYAMQDLHSTDETQADELGSGRSPFGGFQLAGLGPMAEGLASTYTGYVQIREGIVQVVADSGMGQGFETTEAFAVGTVGGALNGVNLDVGSGAAKVRPLVTCAQCPPGVAFAAASLTPIPAPGLPLGGQALLIAPWGPFQATLSVWQGTHTGAATLLPQIAVPAAVAGTTFWIQGGVLDPATLSFTLLTDCGLRTL